MFVIPAIDLKEGQCVRLKQGLMQEATVFSDAPAQMAKHWCQQGARRLHLVDLNGAFAGSPKNFSTIRAILEAIPNDLPVQLGGGIRDIATIERYLDLGLHSVIIGTAAVNHPQFLHDACDAFPGQIIVGIDAKEGKVATDGWAKVSHYTAIDLAKRFEDYGVSEIIYTDIGRDGMLGGINIDATVQLAEALRTPVIASGGLSSIADIRALCDVQSAGISGVIAGRALYEGRINLQEAQDLADQHQ